MQGSYGADDRRNGAWENRIPVAIEYEFTDKLRFRMSSGVELDHSDWGRYFAYDKAFASVMACL
ncbi:MAG: hypothetical protein JSW52_07335 [Candidatus Coatesbacteria bacterium]|nr:MAG: hypothetical protein JSW52_07335 [Candidatus Coatesbacteria bacterium]